MWQDKILYWAWRGREKIDTCPPTKKLVVYDDVLDGPVPYRVAIGVWDDDVYTSFTTGNVYVWDKENL